MTFAKKRQQRLTRLAMAVATTAAAAVLLPLAGCDDSRQADRRVRDIVAEARLERAKPGAEGMQKAQAKLKEAVAEAEAGPATQVHAKAMLGQLNYEAAMSQIADPQDGIDAGNVRVLRLIRELGRLGRQIDESSSQARLYRGMEPVQVRQAVQQNIAEVTGDGNDAVWIGEGEAAIPTLTAAQQQVDQQQAAVTKQQELIKSLQAQQEQVLSQAQQTGSQSDAARGRAGLDLFRQAVGLRKQAADLGTRVEVEQSKLAQLDYALKLAQARQQALATAREQFQRFGEQVEKGWKGVEAQAVQLQQHATKILQGGGDSTAARSVAERAKALADQLNQNRERFETAHQNLTDAVTNYQQAAAAATKLRSELSPQAQGLPSDNQMKKALDTIVEVYHPGTFELGQASSQLALANLQVARAQALTERADLVQQLSKVLSEAGLALPKELEDPNLQTAIAEATKQATENYTAAMETFGTAADGGASDAVKKGGQSGRIYALYGQALLARATGGKPEEHLAAARSARDAVLQESPTALNALPAELVPPPSTQPAATQPLAPTAGAPTTTADAKLPGEPADAATAQAVKQALTDTVTAFDGGDMDAVKARILALPEQQPMVDTLVSLVGGAHKLQKNVAAKFGEEAAKTLFQQEGQPGMKMDIPDLAELQQEIAKIEVRSTGPDAVVLVKPGEEGPLPMRQADGVWKFDMTSLPQQNPQAAAMLPMMTMMFQPIAQGINQLADDVAAGKYQTIDEVKAAMAQLSPTMPGMQGGPAATPPADGAAPPADAAPATPPAAETPAPAPQ